MHATRGHHGGDERHVRDAFCRQDLHGLLYGGRAELVVSYNQSAHARAETAGKVLHAGGIGIVVRSAGPVTDLVVQRALLFRHGRAGDASSLAFERA
jgi:hypothetical protein